MGGAAGRHDTVHEPPAATTSAAAPSAAPSPSARAATTASTASGTSSSSAGATALRGEQLRGARADPCARRARGRPRASRCRCSCSARIGPANASTPGVLAFGSARLELRELVEQHVRVAPLAKRVGQVLDLAQQRLELRPSGSTARRSRARPAAAGSRRACRARARCRSCRGRSRTARTAPPRGRRPLPPRPRRTACRACSPSISRALAIAVFNYVPAPPAKSSSRTPSRKPPRATASGTPAERLGRRAQEDEARRAAAATRSRARREPARRRPGPATTRRRPSAASSARRRQLVAAQPAQRGRAAADRVRRDVGARRPRRRANAASAAARSASSSSGRRRVAGHVALGQHAGADAHRDEPAHPARGRARDELRRAAADVDDADRPARRRRQRADRAGEREARLLGVVEDAHRAAPPRGGSRAQSASRLAAWRIAAVATAWMRSAPHSRATRGVRGDDRGEHGDRLRADRAAVAGSTSGTNIRRARTSRSPAPSGSATSSRVVFEPMSMHALRTALAIISAR